MVTSNFRVEGSERRPTQREMLGAARCGLEELRVVSLGTAVYRVTR